MHPTVGEKGVYRLYLWSPWTTKYASSFKPPETQMIWFSSLLNKPTWTNASLDSFPKYFKSTWLNKEYRLTGITTVLEILLPILSNHWTLSLSNLWIDLWMISLFPRHKSDQSLQRLNPIINLSSLCYDRFCVIFPFAPRCHGCYNLSKSIN